jgi:predicted AlkP superfamily pyrophosphatase or phosphodiesterase
MGANFYAQTALNAHIPNLKRLRAEGSYAEGVEGVYPTVTYPSHSTIVTGRTPAEHGIYSNVAVRTAEKKVEDWFWYAKDFKTPTLWDEARRAHLTSAAVSWPATVGAAIDWNIPEIWDASKDMIWDLQYIAQHATPGLTEEALQAVGPQAAGLNIDVIRTRVAAYIIQKYRPNLMLVHLVDPDHTEHSFGPDSPQAAQALEECDGHVGELLQAIRESGLGGSTDVFIVSDHGFLRTDHLIQPNVLLAKAGLLSTDSAGQITGGKVSTLTNGGSFFLYWPEGEDLRGQVQSALKPLMDEGVLWAEFDRSALHDLGAEPAVQLALDAPEGYAFGNHATGDLISTQKSTGGTHGYLPYRSGLESSFIAWGPDIRPGVNLHRIRMTSEGPTILKALGLSAVGFGDQPPLNEIFK